jgi:dTDP-4-dehydrorhamnose 3,5-epimerase
MSESFNFISTPIDNLYEFERKNISDHRGFFSRLFCAKDFKEIGLIKSFVQVNHAMTRKKGSIRGMHFQNPPYSEAKVVSCIQGEVLDVIVDIRKDSKTFLKYHSVVLSDNNFKGIFIPEGFAHGFQALTDNCQLIYLHSEFYTPSAESVINPLDINIDIKWPCNVSEMSERDQNQTMLDSTFRGI